MSTVLPEYPLDPTGVSVNNLVQGELFALQTVGLRVVAPKHGAFFAASVVVTNTDTGLPLSSSQFYTTLRYGIPTAKFHADVCGLVMITDKSIANVSVNYQAVGSPYSNNAVEFVDMLNKRITADRPLNWGAILPPPPALTADDFTTDRFGFEWMEVAIDGLNEAMLRGDEVGHLAVQAYVDSQLSQYTGGSANLIIADIATHVQDPEAHPQYIKKTAFNSAISVVVQPKNVSPADGSSAVPPHLTSFTGSPYRALYALSQKGMQVQVSLTADFATIEMQASTSAAGTTMAFTGNLQGLMKYFWRCCYMNLEGVSSAWSLPTAFTTGVLTIVQQPTITQPTNNASGIMDGPTFSGSPFTMVNGSDTQVSTDWELWSAPNGTGVLVWSSENDTAHKASITMPTGLLVVNKTYYLRVRYNSMNWGSSSWSADAVFTTASTFVPAAYGLAYGGGYYGGQITYGGHTYAIVVAPKATGEASKALYTANFTPNAVDANDSIANTTALALGAASLFVDALAIGGYTDWQIPAQNVLKVLQTNLWPGGTTTPALYKTGAAEAFSTTVGYWSSTTLDWIRDDSYYEQGSPIYTTTTVHNSVNQATTDVRQTDGTNLGPASPVSCSGFGAGATMTNYTSSVYDPGMKPPGLIYNWTCNFDSTQQTITGYTQGPYHKVLTQVYQGYSVLFTSATTAFTTVDKVTAKQVRAVRLVLIS